MESKEVVGKMRNLLFGIKKPGILEFNIDGDRRLFEEVLVTALALVEARRRARGAAVNTNANAAGGAIMV